MRLVGLVIATALVASCSGGPHAATTTSPRTSSPATAPPALPSALPSAAITKVLTVVLENHGTRAALTGMPYVASLAQQYGRTTDYRALTHPSLPNYLALAGGSTFDVHDDAAPSAHPIGTPSVFDVALARGHTAATYADAMTQPCQQESRGTYVARHNPWVYFSASESRTACAQHDLPITALQDDIRAGTLPDVGLLVPDLCHDGHDCGLDIADDWVRDWFTQLMSGIDYRGGRLALAVTFDEDEGHGDEASDVLTVVVAPGLRGRTVATPLDHRSWCRWMTDLVGASALSGAANVTSLGQAFGL